MNQDPIVSIRAITLADAPSIAEHRYFQPDIPAATKVEYARWQMNAMQDERYFGFVGVVEGRPEVIVAGCGLVLLDWGPGREDLGRFRGRIVNMYVDEAYRKRGLARELLNRLLDLGSTLGVRTFSLSSTSMSRDLYEQVGFRTAAVEMTLTNPRSSATKL